MYKTAAAGTPPGWESRGTLLRCLVQSVTANEPGRQHTTGQSSRSPESGTRKQKTRDVASRGTGGRTPFFKSGTEIH